MAEQRRFTFHLKVWEWKTEMVAIGPVINRPIGGARMRKNLRRGSTPLHSISMATLWQNVTINAGRVFALGISGAGVDAYLIKILATVTNFPMCFVDIPIPSKNYPLLINLTSLAKAHLGLGFESGLEVLPVVSRRKVWARFLLKHVENALAALIIVILANGLTHLI